jgi:hypothetical protein
LSEAKNSTKWLRNKKALSSGLDLSSQHLAV